MMDARPPAQVSARLVTLRIACSCFISIHYQLRLCQWWFSRVQDHHRFLFPLPDIAEIWGRYEPPDDRLRLTHFTVRIRYGIGFGWYGLEPVSGRATNSLKLVDFLPLTTTVKPNSHSLTSLSVYPRQHQCGKCAVLCEGRHVGPVRFGAAPYNFSEGPGRQWWWSSPRSQRSRPPSGSPSGSRPTSPRPRLKRGPQCLLL